jgi:hypothetical protein
LYILRDRLIKRGREIYIRGGGDELKERKETASGKKKYLL